MSFTDRCETSAKWPAWFLLTEDNPHTRWLKNPQAEAWKTSRYPSARETSQYLSQISHRFRMHRYAEILCICIVDQWQDVSMCHLCTLHLACWISAHLPGVWTLRPLLKSASLHLPACFLAMLKGED